MGKTTLANDWCQKHKDFEHLQEVARDVMNQHAITREDMKASLTTIDKVVFLELQRLILEEQNRRELAFDDRPFISDRGPDPLAFTSHYVGQEKADKLAETPAAKALLERYCGYLVVVLCPLEKPTDDGFRLMPDREGQEQFTKVLRELLNKYQVPHIYIDVTDRHERVAMLEQAVRGELPLNT